MFEMVDVQQGQCYRLARRISQHIRQLQHSMAPVRKPGQRVGYGGSQAFL